MARDHGEKDHGHGRGNPHNEFRHDDRDRDRDHGRWEARDRWEYRTYERGYLPPGWKRGAKVGWRDCGMPPGLAKKYGCYRYYYGGRAYYWYHDDGGRVIVRRPIISVVIH
jgi:hypothetical protein